MSAGVPVRAVVTVPPYAPFAAEVAKHPLVAGLRLNTVMPVRGAAALDAGADPAEALAERAAVLLRLADLGPLWVDLKGRQLRVAEAALPPFTSLRLTHRVRVATPCDAFLGDGREHARVLAADGDRLILEDGPRRVVGPGESVNIPDASLEVEGTLTASDRAWLAAMAEAGERRVLLSFAERAGDADEVRAALPGAEVALKIESRRGLALARGHGARLGRLVAARGDLYVEVPRPHDIVGALRDVVAADPDAWAASRILPSLARHPVPEASEIADVALLLALGYRTLVLGDEVCLRRSTVLAALDLVAAIAADAR